MPLAGVVLAYIQCAITAPHHTDPMVCAGIFLASLALRFRRGRTGYQTVCRSLLWAKSARCVGISEIAISEEALFPIRVPPTGTVR